MYQYSSKLTQDGKESWKAIVTIIYKDTYKLRRKCKSLIIKKTVALKYFSQREYFWDKSFCEHEKL